MWPEARRVQLCTQAPSQEDRSDHAGQRWRRSCSLAFALSQRRSFLPRLVFDNDRDGEFRQPRSTLPELCAPRLGCRGPWAPLTRAGRLESERVNLDKRVSELRSVSYVTVRPKAGDSLLTT